MQALCNYEVHRGKLTEPLAALADDAGASPASLDYARTLCEHYELAGKDVDARIQGALDNWDIKRIDGVARNIIRVATIELLAKSVPPKVAVDEGITLAREFGDDESARFVNGVLDPLMKRIAEEA